MQQGPQPQQGGNFLDGLKNFLGGSGILSRLAGNGPINGTPMTPMTPGPAPAPQGSGNLLQSIAGALMGPSTTGAQFGPDDYMRGKVADYMQQQAKSLNTQAKTIRGKSKSGTSIPSATQILAMPNKKGGM